MGADIYLLSKIILLFLVQLMLSIGFVRNINLK